MTKYISEPTLTETFDETTRMNNEHEITNCF